MEEEFRPLLFQSPTSQCSNNVSSLLPWDPQRAKRSGIFILVSVTLERFAFYAVVMNLFLYLNKEQPEIPFVSHKIGMHYYHIIDNFIFRKNRGNQYKQ